MSNSNLSTNKEHTHEWHIFHHYEVGESDREWYGATPEDVFSILWACHCGVFDKVYTKPDYKEAL